MSTVKPETTPTPIERISLLLQLYRNGAIPKLHEHEVNPGLDSSSRENYLYFTLPVCINFQRSSPAMWASALATYNDPSTNYLFFPEKLATTSMEKIRTDLLKHKLALQPNKHVLIWTTIAGSLYQHYDSDPRNVLKESGFDARKLIDNLHGKNRKIFPYLSGPKLSNYWPYILSQYTDATFSNAHEISIIPDTHVIQSSIALGLVTKEAATPLTVEATWRDVLDGSGISPTTMHPVLWNWSRNNFQPMV
ncbi:MAG: hypothetical protein WAS27_02370 [Candidatus Saccharimonadales bacterium]